MRKQKLTGGAAVKMLNGNLGIVNGSVNHNYGNGESISIIWNYRAYKDDKVCSVSGGPGTIATPTECLRPTGEKVNIKFWRFKNDRWAAGNGYDYWEDVELFEQYQTNEEAKSPEKEITKERFNEMYEELPPIFLDHEFMFFDWVRDNKGEPLYFPEVKKAFAISEPYTFSDTVVCSVFYKVHYKTFDENGKWIKYQDPKFFEQLMRIYTPDFRAINDTYAHHYGYGYLPENWYLHDISKLKLAGVF